MPYGVVVEGDLYCRAQPSTSGTSYGKFTNGTRISITDAPNAPDWWQTTWTSASTGYVMKHYVVSAGDTIQIKGSNVNVRPTASTSQPELYRLSNPATAPVIDVTTGTDGGWIKIQPSGKAAGWVCYNLVTKYASGSGSGGGSGGGGTGVNEFTFDQVRQGQNGAVFMRDPDASHATQGVKDLQQYLINIGWGSASVLGSSSALSVDGNFGSKTETAVKLFQEECEISQDGIVGSDTATRLYNAKNSTDFTNSKFHPVPASEWSYSNLPSRIDDISLCARLICAEHSRNYHAQDEDARAGIAKVLRNRKNSSTNFNEVNNLKTFKAIIFGSGQFSPATGSSGSKRMAHFVHRGCGSGTPWSQAILYATQLVNGQTISRAANVTNQVYFNGYTSSWSTTGKKDIIYYPSGQSTNFTAFFNK